MFQYYLEMAKEENSGKNTAIKRNTLALPIQLWLDKKVLTGDNILDYGAGRGDNVRLLKEQFKNVDGYDYSHSGEHVTNDLSKTKSKYDTVISTYMFNVIADDEKFAEALHNIKSKVKPGGKILVAVRADLIKEMIKSKQFADQIKGKSPEEVEKQLIEIAKKGWSTGKNKYQRLVTELKDLKPNEALSKKNLWLTFTN